jgi:hypothetical protein
MKVAGGNAISISLENQYTFIIEYSAKTSVLFWRASLSEQSHAKTTVMPSFTDLVSKNM